MTLRKIRSVSLHISGVPVFEELILTKLENEKVKAAKTSLIGHKVKFAPNAFNRTDCEGIITDIRIVVASGNKIYPCAVVLFADQGYSRLRGLYELQLAGRGAE